MEKSHFEKWHSQDYGYFLHPSRRPSEPGYARLEVMLRDEPTLHHFDPEYMNLNVTLADGGTELVKVSYPWSGALHWRVCAGPVMLADRKEKHIDLYTFGGELTIENKQTFTRAVVNSEAPILLASAPGEPADLLVQEVEIQLAYLRAALCEEQDAFDRCLRCTQPLELYRIFLVAIRDRFRHMPMQDEVMFGLLHTIEDELQVVGLPVTDLVDRKR
ncbi:MAG: hypothetical protein ACOYYS_23565 [Chloroflexota bacterium]